MADARSGLTDEQVAQRPFSVPFEVRAADGRLWIRHRARSCKAESTSRCSWGDWQPERELLLKGVNWSGFEQASTNCPEQLHGFRDARDISEYIDVLRENGFNAVRLPLYANGVLDDPKLNENRCGRLAKSRAYDPPRHYNDALREVVRARAASHSGGFPAAEEGELPAAADDELC